MGVLAVGAARGSDRLSFPLYRSFAESTSMSHPDIYASVTVHICCRVKEALIKSPPAIYIGDFVPNPLPQRSGGVLSLRAPDAAKIKQMRQFYHHGILKEQCPLSEVRGSMCCAANPTASCVRTSALALRSNAI